MRSRVQPRGECANRAYLHSLPDPSFVIRCRRGRGWVRGETRVDGRTGIVPTRGRGDINATQGTLDFEGSPPEDSCSHEPPLSLPRFPFVRFDRAFDRPERNDYRRHPLFDRSARWRCPSQTQRKWINSRLANGGKPRQRSKTPLTRSFYHHPMTFTTRPLLEFAICK